MYFKKDNRDFISKIKKQILNDKGLWNSGIEGTSISGGVRPILLSNITYSDSNERGVIWTDKEIEILYEKMKRGIPDLERVIDRDDPFFSFGDLIQQMVWFTRNFQESLQSKTDFTEIKRQVEYLHFSNIKYKSLDEGLSSKVKADVVWALSEVSDLYHEGLIEIDLIKLILNKVLLQAEPAVEASISYISAWVSKSKDKSGFHGMESSLISILKKFKSQPLPDSDVAFIEEKLANIAFQLDEVAFKDESISWWKNYAERSEFNNIKQLVYKRLHGIH
jgi:hypothetical protein